MRRRRELLLALLSCCGTDERPRDAGVDAAQEGGGLRWPGGPVDVQVVDPEGVAVPEAIVLTGGSLDWALTGPDGRATATVPDDGETDRWLIAGRRGWRTEGVDLAEDAAPVGPVTIVIAPLPAQDNAAYVFGEGGDSASPSTRQCGHCHRAIADGWNGSRHHDALSNPRTRDLWNGTALSADEPGCAALDGRWAIGSVAGAEQGSEAHCYVARGVLPDLNDVCGHEGTPPCDDRGLDRAALVNLGRCGDCHGAAIPGAVPGRVNLNDAVGVTYREGVSCDLCHKVADVTVGPAPGLDGALALLRPSVPSASPLTEYEPIMFGPYPDVLNPFMGASYQPQFRTGELCSGCHEYAQEPLRPDEDALLDRARWPDGIPVHTTYGEWAASTYAPSTTCAACHMPALDLDTAIGDLDELDIGPGIAAGWLRAPGEIRAHTFVGPASLAAAAVDLQLSIEPVLDVAEVRATLSNLGAGHALPTGEPLRQVAVLVTASIDGVPVGAIGGRAIADVGGALVEGILGGGAALDGDHLSFAGASLDDLDATAVRIVRPTGEWVDYAGPGVGWFSQAARTPQEKNVPEEEVVDAVEVVASGGDTVTLARAPASTLPGDRVYLVGAEQWAGAPGALYAKVLIDAAGRRAVPHYRAVEVASDDRLPPHGEGTSIHRFPAPAAGEELVVTARVIYRSAADAVAREYGWPHEDLELLAVERRFTP